MPVSEQNCHPFAHGTYLFMHNGVVAGFLAIRRRLLGELSDGAYNAVQSFHSDSAVCFALFLHHLPSMTAPQPAEALLRALQATIATVARVQAEAGITDTSLLNFVVSDGATMVATRYVSNDAEQPASLYYAEGSGYERSAHQSEVAAATSAAAAVVRAGGGADAGPGAGGAVRGGVVAGEGDYHLAYGGTGARVCLIASEPVTERASDWTEVPKNTALVVCREKGALLTMITAPLTSLGEHPRQAEVQRCLEAVTAAAGIRSGAPPARLGSLTAADLLHAEAEAGGVPATPRLGAAGRGGAPGSQLDLLLDGGGARVEEHRLTGAPPLLPLLLPRDDTHAMLLYSEIGLRPSRVPAVLYADVVPCRAVQVTLGQ
jgi:predicted glutamine amidotransferase